jgi:peptidoglycan/LPS O-acetylase OafA/YrhL
LALGVGPGLVIPPYDEVIDPVSVPTLASAVTAVIAVSFTIAIGSLAVGAWSLVVRFRRARGSERQQLRWVAFAAALTVPPAAVVLFSVVVVDTKATVVLLVALGVCMALLPLAIGVAILRYRLYDLDRLISRALAYGLLTLLLASGYAALVLGLGQLLGQDSSLVVAAATLAVAAVFQPARRRIQQGVDRRFNRRRHDAAQTIATFSTRLRDQVDLTTLTSELLTVVDQTMQPTRASLWLRPPAAATTIDQTAAH